MATAMDEHIRFKSLFSKYLKLGNPNLNNFILSIPSKFDNAVKILNENPSPELDENITINRKNLKNAISNFHQKSRTLTSTVKSQIDLLEEKKLKIVVAIHQPNLFAFSGVYKKIILLETLSKYLVNSNNFILPLFLIIDHDFMDDSWVHVAKLPSVRNASGILDIRYPMNNSKRWKIICRTDPPTHSLVRCWENQIYSWIKNDKSLTKEQVRLLFSNLEKLWNIVEDSLSLSNNYSEFNSIIMSKIVNTVWNYRTLFVNLSDLYHTFNQGYNFLLSNHETYLNSLESSELFFKKHGISKGISSNSGKYSPLWLHCSCGSKGYSIVNINSNGELELLGKCISCKRKLELNVGKQNSINIPKDKLSEVSPRAIPILLLLSRELRISGYITGTGGSLGYTMIGKKVFDDLKIKMPVLLLWAANDIYTGFAQKEALDLLQENNIKDISKFLFDAHKKSTDYQNQIKPLISKRNRVYKDGSNNSLSNLLNELFYYKNEQRKLKTIIKTVEKSNNALTLKACIIDYIVNFGMENLAGKWSSNLIKNNDFTSPLIMTSYHQDEKN
ncbi:MAG: hypothetical protein ABJB73_11655 [Candidatus Nitrosocosmicus sp.]